MNSDNGVAHTPTSIGGALQNIRALELFSMSGKYQIASVIPRLHLCNYVSARLDWTYNMIDPIVDALQDEGGQVVANPCMILSTRCVLLHLIQMAQRVLLASYKMEAQTWR